MWLERAHGVISLFSNLLGLDVWPTVGPALERPPVCLGRTGVCCCRGVGCPGCLRGPSGLQGVQSDAIRKINGASGDDDNERSKRRRLEVGDVLMALTVGRASQVRIYPQTPGVTYSEVGLNKQRKVRE